MRMDKKELLKAILSRFVALVIITVFAVAMTVALSLYQTMYPDKIDGTVRPEDFGMTYEQVSFKTVDDVKIAGWYIPKKDGESDTTIIVLHGYPTSKSDLMARSAFLHGYYNLLLVDFRYFGESEGKYTTVGIREIEDLLAAVQYLKHDREMEKVGVYGFSMGGSVALMGLSQTNDIDAVISEAAYADLHLMAEELYRSFGPFKGVFANLTAFAAELVIGADLATVSPVNYVKETDVPILLIHSKEDKVIPFTHAEMLQEALKDNPKAEFSFGDELLHGQASVEFAQKMLDFFVKHLGKNDHGVTSFPENSGA